MFGSIIVKDMFLGIDVSKIHGDCDISRTYKSKDKKEFCIQIAGVFLDAMFTDLLSGVCKIALTKFDTSIMQITKYTKDDFIRMKKNNVNLFKDQDPFKSNFTGYFPVVSIHRKGFVEFYSIFLNAKYKKIFSDAVNQGNRFNTVKIKYSDDYIDLVHSKFDKIHKESIKYILKYLTNKMYKLIYYRFEMHLTHKKYQLSIFIKSNYKKSANTNYDSMAERHIKRVFYLSKYGQYKHDGYYYFAINDKQNEKFIKTGNTGVVKIFKFFECTMVHMYNGHIYKVKLDEENIKNSYIINNYEKSDVEYVSRRNKLRSRHSVSTKQYSNRLS